MEDIKQKWQLWGLQCGIVETRIGGCFEEQWSRDLLAIFSTLEKAQEYVERSRLRNPGSPRRPDTKIFKKRSLLFYYQDCEIVEFRDPPFDPEI